MSKAGANAKTLHVPIALCPWSREGGREGFAEPEEVRPQSQGEVEPGQPRGVTHEK
jgi:hypothetical protein